LSSPIKGQDSHLGFQTALINMNTPSVPLEEHFWQAGDLIEVVLRKQTKCLGQSEDWVAMLDIASLWKETTLLEDH
jgi:hypothetical protein